MTNLNRLLAELQDKQYFATSDTYIALLDENGLDSDDEYDRDTDRVKLLETVYAIMQALANNIDAFRKVETEFATTTAAYQYLQTRLKDIRTEIDRIKTDSGSTSIVGHLFYSHND